MKTINTISDTLGYTIDTYGQFSATDAIADDDWTDETEIDHVAYVADLANYCAETLNKYADNIMLEVTCTGSYSPREYNFATDNAELMIKLDDKRLMAYIIRHLPEFTEYLKDNFTSYDGFMSYVPNNWPEFTKQLYGGDTIDSDRNWAIMLGWYLRKSETLTRDDYIDDMNDHVSEAAYNNAINLKEED